MISKIESKITSWKENQWLNLNEELSDSTLDIMSSIIFAKNINEKIGSFTYIKPNGNEVQLEYIKMFKQVIQDNLKSAINPLTFLLPFLEKYSLCKPFTTIKKNSIELRNKLQKFLDDNPDESSVYEQLVSEYKVDKTQALYDIIILSFAGYDTVSHAICSVIYYMKANPKSLEKLKSEFDKIGINQHSDFSKSEVKEKIQNCDYFMYCVKETLRIDPPAFISLPYITIDDVEICGVKINKNEHVMTNIIYVHHNSKEWQKPLEFIPERFDPESPYFVRPDGKPRSPYSFIPFMVGDRKCPGQTLAMLEIKVIAAKILTSIDYDIDEELLKNKYTRFGVLSNFKIKLKLNKRYD